jgi:uncharacterized protein (TIGR03083 family)
MNHPRKILVVDRFAPLRSNLLTLLAEFSEHDWDRPTVAPGWSVKDVTAHLVGGDLGILARERDGLHPSSTLVSNYQDIVELVNRLNEEWVLAARRLSPRLLRELLAFTGPAVEAHFSSLDPDAVGGPVSWAGPEPAPVWFDLAREFTERWHHQQQIRDATGHAPLYEPYFLAPVLETFLRGLPHSFRHTSAPDATVVRLEITGSSGGIWYLVRSRNQWELTIEPGSQPAADVSLPQDAAWRMFTKGMGEAKARACAVANGDFTLIAPIFTTVSIIG